MRAARSAGRRLRYAFAANAVSTVLMLISLAVGLRGGFHFPAHDSDASLQLPRAWVVLELLAVPTNIVRIGCTVLLILWMHNAGKVADLEGWPRVRDRSLGALSVLIPIVNLWWPYEAVRDLFPPGSRPPFLLRWWVTHFAAPISAFISVFIATIAGSLSVCCVVIVVSAAALAYPAVLGWRLVGALDETYGRLLPGDAGT